MFRRIISIVVFGVLTGGVASLASILFVYVVVRMGVSGFHQEAGVPNT